MTYSLKKSAPIDFAKISKIPSVPNWVIDQMPMNKRCHTQHVNGDWFIDGKQIFDPNRQEGE